MSDPIVWGSAIGTSELARPNLPVALSATEQRRLGGQRLENQLVRPCRGCEEMVLTDGAALEGGQRGAVEGWTAWTACLKAASTGRQSPSGTGSALRVGWAGLALPVFALLMSAFDQAVDWCQQAALTQGKHPPRPLRVSETIQTTGAAMPEKRSVQGGAAAGSNDQLYNGKGSRRCRSGGEVCCEMIAAGCNNQLCDGKGSAGCRNGGEACTGRSRTQQPAAPDQLPFPALIASPHPCLGLPYPVPFPAVAAFPFPFSTPRSHRNGVSAG
eukprot:364391-Chlamydomonas_euryale.AAC.7